MSLEDVKLSDLFWPVRDAAQGRDLNVGDTVYRIPQNHIRAMIPESDEGLSAMVESIIVQTHGNVARAIELQSAWGALRIQPVSQLTFRDNIFKFDPARFPSEELDRNTREVMNLLTERFPNFFGEEPQEEEIPEEVVPDPIPAEDLSTIWAPLEDSTGEFLTELFSGSRPGFWNEGTKIGVSHLTINFSTPRNDFELHTHFEHLVRESGLKFTQSEDWGISFSGNREVVIGIFGHMIHIIDQSLRGVNRDMALSELKRFWQSAVKTDKVLKIDTAMKEEGGPRINHSFKFHF